MPLPTRSDVRRIVRPVVGERGWEMVRRADEKVRHLREPLAKVRGRQPGERAVAAMSGDLTKLATHFGTDKWGNHRYTPHYQSHLADRRGARVKLLEIGIGGYARAEKGGASLRMWKAFFPRGQITGLDLHDKSFVNEDRIRAYRGDQTDAVLLKKINAEAGPFDVIIDDGSHRPEHVIATFEILFPLLKTDGIYVVEDTQTSYWPEFGGDASPDSQTTSMAFFKRMADGLNWEEFVNEAYEPSDMDRTITGLHFYHNLVFIEKGENQEGTNKQRILLKKKQRLAKRTSGG